MCSREMADKIVRLLFDDFHADTSEMMKRLKPNAGRKNKPSMLEIIQWNREAAERKKKKKELKIARAKDENEYTPAYVRNFRDKNSKGNTGKFKARFTDEHVKKITELLESEGYTPSSFAYTMWDSKFKYALNQNKEFRGPCSNKCMIALIEKFNLDKDEFAYMMKYGRQYKEQEFK